MKRKLLNTSMIYFGLAIAAGVFYREFTKMSGYSGETMLRFVHAHLFVLGMALFLVIALFCNQERSLMEDKTFKQFFKQNRTAESGSALAGAGKDGSVGTVCDGYLGGNGLLFGYLLRRASGHSGRYSGSGKG